MLSSTIRRLQFLEKSEIKEIKWIAVLQEGWGGKWAQ